MPPQQSTSKRLEKENYPQQQQFPATRGNNQQRQQPQQQQGFTRDALDNLMRDNGKSGCGIPGLADHYDNRKGVSAHQQKRDEERYYADAPPSRVIRSAAEQRDGESSSSRTSAPAPLTTQRRGSNGTLSGQDYASLLREQIAQKKLITSQENDRYDNHDSRRSSGATNYSSNNRYEDEEVEDRQKSRQRIANSRYDSSMENYKNRQETGREADYRRLQNQHPVTYEQPERERDSSRSSRNPPGGQSSFSIGWN